MKTSQFILTLLLSSLIAFGISYYRVVPAPSHSTQNEAYDRIMRTRTIRCGYALYEPLLGKDPNTGALHGVFYDLINEIGHELDLKIDWTAEIGYGEIEEGFGANKYDVFCNGTALTPKRAQFVSYTTPIYFQTIVAWVRTNDDRFDKTLRRINAPDISIAVRDGDVNETIAHKSFPLAKTISSPQMDDYTQMLMDVATGKADVAFFEMSFGDRFLAKNPGTLKIAMPNTPVDVSPVVLMLPFEEEKLKSVLNSVLSKLILNGTVKDYFHKDAPDYDLWSTSEPYTHIQE